MLIGKNPLNEAPEWFVKNIAERPEECSVNVNGANVKYFIWGDKSKNLCFCFTAITLTHFGGIISLLLLLKIIV